MIVPEPICWATIIFLKKRKITMSKFQVVGNLPICLSFVLACVKNMKPNTNITQKNLKYHVSRWGILMIVVRPVLRFLRGDFSSVTNSYSWYLGSLLFLKFCGNGILAVFIFNRGTFRHSYHIRVMRISDGQSLQPSIRKSSQSYIYIYDYND